MANDKDIVFCFT